MWKLRLPWLWIFIGLAVGLTEADLMLKLPNTTAELLSGDLSGSALISAVWYYVLVGVVGVTSMVLQANAQNYSVRRTRDTVWKKMLGMKMEYFDRNDPSELMSVITNDSLASFDFVNLFLNLVPAIYYVVGAMKTIGGYHIALALSCFVLFPVKYLYAFIMGRVFQKSSIRLYSRIGVLTGFLADRIEHLQLIKTYTNEDEEQLKGEECAKELLRANMRIVHQDNVSTAALSVMDILQKFVVIAAAVVLLQKKLITIEMWLAFFLFSQSLFSYVDQLFDSWTRVKSMQGTLYRIVEIMESDDENEKKSDMLDTRGDVTFRNVTFSYPETDSPALKNVSFTVPGGSSVAIVGLCGSGKTTTVSLLERLYTPDEGSVLVGDKDIREVSLNEYRQKLAYVQQGAGIFGGTLRELLTYGVCRSVTDEEVYAASEKTGFYEYLSLCPEGLDTYVASGGTSMSGGQSQRLVLTRELLRGGDIILLDEPTSALDVRVSEKIQETVDSVFADKTRILVTHDLRFAQRYDKIIVMSGGCLVGEGTHDELMRDCPQYRAMNENGAEVAV